MPPKGWSPIAIGNPGIPRVLLSESASRINLSEHIVTVLTPNFSNSTESWIHHEVQDPQSANPTIAKSTSAPIHCKVSSSTGIEAVHLL